MRKRKPREQDLINNLAKLSPIETTTSMHVFSITYIYKLLTEKGMLRHGFGVLMIMSRERHGFGVLMIISREGRLR